MGSRQFAVLLSITFFVGMIWLISDIIFNTKASIPMSPKLESLLQTVNPNFNSRVLDLISQEVIDSDSIPLSTPPSIAPVVSPSVTSNLIPPGQSSTISATLGL